MLSNDNLRIIWIVVVHEFRFDIGSNINPSQ